MNVQRNLSKITDGIQQFATSLQKKLSPKEQKEQKTTEMAKSSLSTLQSSSAEKNSSSKIIATLRSAIKNFVTDKKTQDSSQKILHKGFAKIISPEEELEIGTRTINQHMKAALQTNDRDAIILEGKRMQAILITGYGPQLHQDKDLMANNETLKNKIKEYVAEDVKTLESQIKGSSSLEEDKTILKDLEEKTLYYQDTGIDNPFGSVRTSLQEKIAKYPPPN